jgi:hypothetical protein
MDQSDPKGAFGETLARYYHQSESKTAVTSWPEQRTFAITRLHSEVGLPEVSQPIPEEAALHVSIAIKPVPLRSYELYIDGRRDCARSQDQAGRNIQVWNMRRRSRPTSSPSSRRSA